jgi:hypothetical protein
MAGPFGDLEPAPGRVLASPSTASSRVNLWFIVRLSEAGRVVLACPMRDTGEDGVPIANRGFSSIYEPDKGEWIGPDLTSVKTYLRLIGKEFA